jgi:hypothetical protein
MSTKEVPWVEHPQPIEVWWTNKKTFNEALRSAILEHGGVIIEEDSDRLILPPHEEDKNTDT